MLSAAGAVVGVQLLPTLGVTPNTSLVGALAAMLLGRVRIGGFRAFRSVHAQNLAQSAMSAATFGAANSLLLPIGIPWLIGRPDLVLPMFGGAAFAMLLDAWLLYRLFGTELFPATAAWPPGVAAAEAIRAGDAGGRQAAVLGAGLAAGIAGSWLGVPMAAAGIAFIGNMWALAMFGVGLLASGYGEALFGRDLMAAYIPHGMMVGAGLVALLQVAMMLGRRGGRAEHATTGTPLRRSLGMGAVAWLAIATGVAVAGGLLAQLSLPRLALFVAFAALAAFVHEIIVGIAAMHSGWFPAFAVALITLLGGILLGFPPVPLALLAGFTVATGPAFADMGYDLRAGFLLRGSGADPEFERIGRREQLRAAMVAFLVAIPVVLLAWHGLFVRDLVPPVARVYAATIEAGAAPGIARSLFLWAIPGALAQLAGGPRRQLGVLLSTGLLVANTAAGWAVLAGLVARVVVVRRFGRRGERTLEVLAGGFIAGDALFGFTGSMARRIGLRGGIPR